MKKSLSTTGMKNVTSQAQSLKTYFQRNILLLESTIQLSLVFQFKNIFTSWV